MLFLAPHTVPCASPCFKGGGEQDICRQGTSWCYWSWLQRYGIHPLLDNAQEKDIYLRSLCYSSPDDVIDDSICKQHIFSHCTDAEKEKFARMERGYSVLRGQITSAESCQSAAQLRECMNLSAIATCNPRPEFPAETFAAHVHNHQRGAQILKTCVEEAVRTCDAQDNATAIADLQKILDAIVDLAWPYDEPNAS